MSQLTNLENQISRLKGNLERSRETLDPIKVKEFKSWVKEHLSSTEIDSLISKMENTGGTHADLSGCYFADRGNDNGLCHPFKYFPEVTHKVVALFPNRFENKPTELGKSGYDKIERFKSPKKYTFKIGRVTYGFEIKGDVETKNNFQFEYKSTALDLYSGKFEEYRRVSLYTCITQYAFDSVYSVFKYMSDNDAVFIDKGTDTQNLVHSSGVRKFLLGVCSGLSPLSMNKDCVVAGVSKMGLLI
jgi:hypothetical protein